MARNVEDLRPAIVVVNPDEDCSASACRLMIDEILSAPEESVPKSLHAADILRELRDPTR